MRTVIVINNSGAERIWVNKTYEIDEEYTLPSEELILEYFQNSMFISDLSTGSALISNGENILDFAGGISLLSEKSPIAIDSTPAFATPTHRTKLCAVDAPVTIAPSGTENIDFLITSPANSIYGGNGFVIGAEPGDWIEAKVVDANSIIPEPSRATSCEPSPGWPVVSTYVVKQWIKIPGNGSNAFFEINTYPLISEVTPGLFLRTIYHATSAGANRTVYGNIFSLKKL